jgi:predicted alpha/beta hydrolase family esterase
LKESYLSSFKEEAHRLHKLIEQTFSSKPIVFVTHSFGDYILASYFHLYKNERVIGIINIGGIPIRSYPRIRFCLSFVNEKEWEEIKPLMNFMLESFLKVTPPNPKLYETEYNV